MLLLRPRSKDGRQVAGRLPVHRVRDRKFGPVIHERQLRRTQDIAIYGAHSAGKSRWLAKLADGAAEVWPGRPALILRALEPITAWIDQEHVAAWHNEANPRKPWEKLAQHQRIEALVTWCTAVKPVLLLDDAHRLTGRKGEIVSRLVGSAGLVVHTASEETRIPLSLRMALAHRTPQVVRLSSAAAYDYTGVLTWGLCILAAAMGAWPIAAAIGGLKVLARGSRASKQT